MSKSSSECAPLFKEDDFSEALKRVGELGHSPSEFKGWCQQYIEVKNVEQLRCGEHQCETLSEFLVGVIHSFVEWHDSLEKLEIDESNFEDYFFDVRHNKPKPGQVLACHESLADLIDGNLKRDFIHVLMHSKKGGSGGPRLLQKLAGATEESSYALTKSILGDLLSGMSTDEVASKPYEFRCQHFYYTWRGCIPTNDPHWWSASLIDVRRWTDEEIDGFIERAGDQGTESCEESEN